LIRLSSFSAAILRNVTASTREETQSEPTVLTDGLWTSESIDRFWKYRAEHRDLDSQYFTFQVGRGVVNFLDFANRLKTDVAVLDYGCGPGFLIEKLLSRDVVCAGIDNSARAVELVNQKFEGKKNWMGAVKVSTPPAPFPDSKFDVITCLETLEHLPADQLDAVVAEIYRLLKPGGVALFSTPNEENLLLSHIYCPFCQTSFHSVQHLNSFSVRSMRALTESHGFSTIFCSGINFEAFQRRPSLRPFKDLSLSKFGTWIGSRRRILLDRISPRNFPNGRDFQNHLSPAEGTFHLCALVKKPE
jgi:SAM-dependent methyltransferase